MQPIVGVLGALVAQAWLIAAAPAPDGVPEPTEPQVTPDVAGSEVTTPPTAEPPPDASPEPSTPPSPPVLPPAPSSAPSVDPPTSPPATAEDNGWLDARAVRDELVDPWSVGPAVGAAAPPDRASLRDPFARRSSAARRSPPPGTVVVAQLDLQDPFTHRRAAATSAPITPTRATLDLHDPFADGAAVRWNPCKAQETVGGVVVQRPRAVQEHAEAQCSRREAGPLRDPFARPRASTASPPPAPPVSPRARSV